MGKIKTHTISEMYKVLQVILVLAIVQHMSCGIIPKKICNKVRSFGKEIAHDVIHCANDMAAKALKKSGSPLNIIADKIIKISKANEKHEQEIAQKLLKFIMQKIGCRRRLFKFSLHNLIHGVSSFIKNPLGTLCKTLLPTCKNGIKWAVGMAKPIMKKLKIPSECASKSAVRIGTKVCNDICKGH